MRMYGMKITQEPTNEKITDTTEVWSRVNSSHNINATTPTPPTGAPDVLK